MENITCSDNIYEYVLIHGAIALEAAVTRAPRSRIAVGGEVGFCEALYQKHKLSHPLSYRSTWKIPLKDLAVPEAEFQLDSSVVYLTYQLAVPEREHAPRTIDVSVLLVCKQIYFEAIEIFYGKNEFSFTSDFCIPTAATFLRDRPSISLRYIRSLLLHLEELEEPRILEYERGVTGCLQFDYGFFSELCSILSSPEMGLRCLSLSIDTLACYFHNYAFPVSKFLDSENAHLSDLKSRLDDWAPDLPLWSHDLLSIRTLNQLSILWVSRGSHVRVIGKLAATMGQHMLQDQNRPAGNDTYRKQQSIEILSQARNRSGERSSSMMVYQPNDGSYVHRECEICSNGFKLIETTKAEPEANTTHPFIQKNLKQFGYCLCSYYELNLDGR